MENILINNLDFPVITVTTFLPLAGAFLILFIRNEVWIKWLALATTVATFIFSIPIYTHFDKATYKMQFVEIHQWIPAWNINYKVGVDGICVIHHSGNNFKHTLCVGILESNSK